MTVVADPGVPEFARVYQDHTGQPMTPEVAAERLALGWTTETLTSLTRLAEHSDTHHTGLVPVASARGQHAQDRGFRSAMVAQLDSFVVRSAAQFYDSGVRPDRSGALVTALEWATLAASLTDFRLTNRLMDPHARLTSWIEEFGYQALFAYATGDSIFALKTAPQPKADSYALRAAINGLIWPDETLDAARFDGDYRSGAEAITEAAHEVMDKQATRAEVARWYAVGWRERHIRALPAHADAFLNAHSTLFVPASVPVAFGSMAQVVKTSWSYKAFARLTTWVDGGLTPEQALTTLALFIPVPASEYPAGWDQPISDDDWLTWSATLGFNSAVMAFAAGLTLDEATSRQSNGVLHADDLRMLAALRGVAMPDLPDAS